MTEKHYGLAIVLANWMEVDGTLNTETQARVDQAAQMYLSGLIERILFLGWDYRDDTSLCVSDAMNMYILRHFPVQPKDIFIDRSSRDTVGDAIFSKRDFGDLNCDKPMCIVTSDYHRERVKIIFDFVYGKGSDVDVLGLHTGHAEAMAEREKASLAAFHRTFSGVQAGDQDAIYRMMVEKHPYYNGDVHPPIEN